LNFGAFVKIGAEMRLLVTQLLRECVSACPHITVEQLNRFAQEIFIQALH
jgi:hypothetical protein